MAMETLDNDDKILQVKEQKIKNVAHGIEDIHQRIQKLTGGRSDLSLRGPIDFDTIVKWPAPDNCVKMFLGGDHSANNERIDIKISSVGNLSITMNFGGATERELVVRAGKENVELLAYHQRDLSELTFEGLRSINNCHKADIPSQFREIALAEIAVQFVQNAINAEVAAALQGVET